MDKNTFIVMVAVLAMQALASCATCSRTQQDDFVVPDSVRNVSATISESVIKEVVDNISSPIETAALFKSLNVPFAQKYLATTKNLSDYHTACAKAFNLGIFGADLGYINMYGKVSLVSVNIIAMKSLADGLNIGQFFNYTTLKHLSDNNENIDSLIYISQQSFNKMDRYLRQSGRGNLSIVMVTGVWVEAMYLSCQFYKDRPNARLAESIVEQKLLLAELLNMLQVYKGQKEVADLIGELTAIEATFEPVEMLVQDGNLEEIESDGALRVVQHDATIVKYTPEQLAAVISAIENVRNKLIK
ncbi:MAG: hypothetical protein LBN37_03895 [Bacteroidales bacterium]|jgi:hypothetical protein|nr:hypothetical protein [Bacteroidales bacterium]